MTGREAAEEQERGIARQRQRAAVQAQEDANENVKNKLSACIVAYVTAWSG